MVCIVLGGSYIHPHPVGMICGVSHAVRRRTAVTCCRNFAAGSTEEELSRLLTQVASGALPAQSALEKIRPMLTGEKVVQLGNFAKFDKSRQARAGFPEVVYAEGKTEEQVRHILLEMMKHYDGSAPVVASRVSQTMWKCLKDIDGLKYHHLARLVIHGEKAGGKLGTVAILCAGTSDLPVAEEAALVLEACGVEVQRAYDVGVAGIHRLFSILPTIEKAQYVICVAGMDGALPSVVAGLVRCPVVAVPTSVGYGAAFSGLAPLLTMLNSCAPGLSVCNIDNGLGAAAVAMKTLGIHHVPA
jgi:NCAIR mutase (PurE)-related protein